MKIIAHLLWWNEKFLLTLQSETKNELTTYWREMTLPAKTKKLTKRKWERVFLTI